MCSVSTEGGEATTAAMMHVAAVRGHMEVVRELIKRGATVDLQTGLGFTALMAAAGFGHHAIVLLLLQHSANPNMQPNSGQTALMAAAGEGHLACVQALLQHSADPELLDDNGGTALRYAENKRHTAIATLIRQHASCLSLGLGAGVCAALPLTSWPWPLTWPWVVLVLWVALGTMIALYNTIRDTVGSGQRQAARQRRPHRSDARHAKAKGRATAAEHACNSRRHAAPPQPTAKVVALPAAAAPARPPTAAPKPAASAAERSEAALRAAIAGGGLHALERALAAAPRQVWDGGVGMEARSLCDMLLRAQQRAEREAKQEAATEAARLEAAERARPAREATAREAARAAAASKARAKAKEAAATAAAAAKAAAAAEAEAAVLERAMAGGGEGSSSGAARPSEASGTAAEVPDDYMCPITAEIMTDPVCTSDGFTYERTAITEWLRTKDTSPLTGAALESKTLVPNLSLRSIICRFVGA